MPDPEPLNVRASIAAIPEDVRPDLRWYTIRSHDRAAGRIDVDIVTHGDSGPGSAWTVRRVGRRPRRVPGERRPLPRARPRRAAGPRRRRDRRPLGGRDPRGPRRCRGRGRAAASRSTSRWPTPPCCAPTTSDRPRSTSGGASRAARSCPALDTHLAAGGAPVVYAWACGETDLAAGARRALVRHGVRPSQDLLLRLLEARPGPRLTRRPSRPRRSADAGHHAWSRVGTTSSTTWNFSAIASRPIPKAAIAASYFAA